MEEYLKNQIIFNTIANKINNDNINVQAYMLSCEDKEILQTASSILSKILICPSKYSSKCENCNICKKIDNDDFIELKKVVPKNNVIKKENIINIRNEFQTKSISAKNRVYIVEECQYLGEYAANSILKFLEEPPSNIIGIFTTTDLSKVLETIKSRCQIIKLNNKKQIGYDYIKQITGFDEENIYDIVKYFYVLETNNKKSIIDTNELYINKYKDKSSLQNFLKLLELLYIDKLNKKIFGNYKYFDNLDENKINNVESTDQIIKKINILMEYIEKSKYNLNTTLFVNDLTIRIGEI